MERVSIEKCLKEIPNKFKLAVIAMNRARSILLGSKTSVADTKYAKKSVNKSLIEIENEKIDLDSFEKEVRHNLLVNNLFLKDTHSVSDISDIDTNDSGNVIDLSADTDIDLSDSDSEDIDDEEGDFTDGDSDLE